MQVLKVKEVEEKCGKGEGSFMIFQNAPYLPVSWEQLVLQLEQPVLLHVVAAVVHSEDDGPSQQCPWGSTAHHWTQHRLDVLHRGPGDRRTGTRKMSRGREERRNRYKILLCD